MTGRRVPFPIWPADRRGTGWCRWCGEEVIDAKTGGRSKRASWHRDCLGDFFQHSRRESQFAFVRARDGLKCAVCGSAPERWLKRGEVIVWIDDPMPWRGRRRGRAYWDALAAYRRANPAPRYTEIARVTALEVDHIVPLWSIADLPPDRRRAFFGPANLQLLCPDHHRAKTRREAGERAALKRKRLAA